MGGESDTRAFEQAQAEPLGPQETALWHAWGRTRHRMSRELDESMIRATGLSMVEFATLNILHARPHGSARPGDVAVQCGLSASRISRMGDSLVQRGLCGRDRDGTDGRGTLLVLTERGRAVRDAADAHQNRLARHYLLDHIPREHLDLFVEVVTAISRTPPPPPPHRAP